MPTISSTVCSGAHHVARSGNAWYANKHQCDYESLTAIATARRGPAVARRAPPTAALAASCQTFALVTRDTDATDVAHFVAPAIQQSNARRIVVATTRCRSLVAPTGAFFFFFVFCFSGFRFSTVAQPLRARRPPPAVPTNVPGIAVRSQTPNDAVAHIIIIFCPTQSSSNSSPSAYRHSKPPFDVPPGDGTHKDPARLEKFRAMVKERLTKYPWYSPGLRRQDAEAKLAGKAPKTFVLRDSSIPHCLALSHVAKDGRTIVHVVLEYETFRQTPFFILPPPDIGIVLNVEAGAKKTAKAPMRRCCNSWWRWSLFLCRKIINFF